MKKLALVFAMLAAGAGCTEQMRARSYGGSASIALAPGVKLVTATWKESDLWLLTRKAKQGEQPETYTFKESSSMGLLEGTVIIQER